MGPACIGCGCTDDHACPGGCSWVSLDPPLCSACADGWNEEPVAAVAATSGEIPRMSPADDPCRFGCTPIFTDEHSGYCVRCREPIHA